MNYLNQLEPIITSNLQKYGEYKDNVIFTT